MSTETNQKTVTGDKYNPTITAFFDAPKFGIRDAGVPIEGSAFLSAEINAESFHTIQKHVQLGTKLLLRQSKNLNSKGGRTFFLEVLPPLGKGNNNRSSTNSGNAASV